MDAEHPFRELFGGPGTLRFILQPLMAIALGFRDGRLDAAAGRTPFLMSLVVDEAHRSEIAQRAMRAIVVPFTIAVAIDLMLQHFVKHSRILWLSMLVGGLLVALPYVVSRSLSNRAVRWSSHRISHTDPV